MLIPFPTEFPKETLDIVEAAWAGQMPDVSVATNAAWNLAGFGLGKTFPASGMHATAPPSDEQVKDAFAKAKECCKDGPGMHAIAIPAEVLMVLVQVAISLLQKWLAGMTPAP